MAYHSDQGEQHRNICLIPASAHGTNAASAQMAGLQVVTLPTNKDGSVSVSVFKEEVSGLLSPATHFVYICTSVHLHHYIFLKRA